MSKEPKREEKREKRAERTTKSCGEEASEHPRLCSRVGGGGAGGHRGEAGGGAPYCGVRSSTKSWKSL